MAGPQGSLAKLLDSGNLSQEAGKGRYNLLGHWQIPHHKHRTQRDNKRNIKWCRKPLSSLRFTELPCQVTHCASSMWALVSWNIKRGSRHRR